MIHGAATRVFAKIFRSRLNAVLSARQMTFAVLTIRSAPYIEERHEIITIVDVPN
jgi:hypothetical protein